MERHPKVITPVLDPEGERWQWAAIHEFAAVSKRARNNLKNSKRLFSSEVLFGWPTCPSSVSVSKSLPLLWNVKSGVVGLSRKGSVWLSTSAQLMTLVTTSRWGSEIDGLRLALSDFDIPHDEMVYVQSLLYLFGQQCVFFQAENRASFFECFSAWSLHNWTDLPFKVQ